MIVGSLGDIVFEVSDKVLQSFEKLNFSGSANISIHSIRLRKGKPEFVGTDPEKASMSIRVSKLLGADPDDMIEKIRTYMSSAKILRLQLGKKTFGSYRWLINEYKVIHEDHDRFGNLIDASISLTLIEYPKE